MRRARGALRALGLLAVAAGPLSCEPTIELGFDCHGEGCPTRVIRPFETFVPPADPDDFRLQPVMLSGNAVSASQWGADSSDAERRGALEFRDGALRFWREPLSFCEPSGDAAPDCLFSAGSVPGRYCHSDHSVFPFGPALNVPFGALRSITAHFGLSLLTTQGYTDCGFAFAFGQDAPPGAPELSRLPKDLRLCGRESGHDFFRLMYRAQNYGYVSPASREALVVDAPMNESDGRVGFSVAEWYAETFTVQAGDSMKHHGDRMEFELQLVFAHAAHSVRITLTPTSGGSSSAPFLDPSGWRAQTATWVLDAPIGTLQDGQPRAGLAFASFPAECDTYEELVRQSVAIGLTFNGSPRECAVSGLEIELSE